MVLIYLVLLRLFYFVIVINRYVKNNITILTKYSINVYFKEKIQVFLEDITATFYRFIPIKDSC